MAKEKKEPAAEAAEFKLEKISFHLAILQSDGGYFAEECETLDALVARVKELTNKDVTVFAFAGQRLKISKPPMRHLLVPGREPIPLFDLPTDFEEDDTGYLGVDPVNMDDPPQLRVPNKSAPPAPDMFGDDDDGGLDVFGGVLPDPDS